eukprot:448988-Rhodomonas_salina.3
MQAQGVRSDRFIALRPCSDRDARQTLGEFNSDWVRGKDEKMRRMRIEADQHTEEVETTMKGLRKRFSNAGIKGWKA